MAEDKKFIGFDLGAESGRCIVAILKNNKVALHEVHRFNTHNVKYFNNFHWDILAIFKDIVTGLKKARESFGSSFDGIGIDTWGVDYVLIDSENKILGYPFHYRDDRTDLMMEEAFKKLNKEAIYEKTGIQFYQFNTLFQLFAEKKNKNSLLNTADKMLLMPDFLNFMLSGVKKAEYSIASTTGLIDPYKREWSSELIKTFGFPVHIFPEIVEPASIIGTLLPQIAQETGLDSQIPIIAIAGHDTASAVASVPSQSTDWAFLSSGTWSLMGIELQKPIISSDALKYNFTNEGGIEQTVRFLKNIIGLWPVQECRRYWLAKGKEFSYAELMQMARENGTSNAWIDLSDIRFLKAGKMPEKILDYLKETGQPAKEDIGFIIRVINESLAYKYRNTLREIETVSNKKLACIHAVGGGIQNELLNQLAADAIGQDMITGPVEGTVVGNIGAQAMATSVVSNVKQWRGIVANSFDVKVYKQKNSEYFNENEANYLGILQN